MARLTGSDPGLPGDADRTVAQRRVAHCAGVAAANGRGQGGLRWLDPEKSRSRTTGPTPCALRPAAGILATSTRSARFRRATPRNSSSLRAARRRDTAANWPHRLAGTLASGGAPGGAPTRSAAATCWRGPRNSPIAHQGQPLADDAANRRRRGEVSVGYAGRGLPFLRPRGVAAGRRRRQLFPRSRPPQLPSANGDCWIPDSEIDTARRSRSCFRKK